MNAKRFASAILVWGVMGVMGYSTIQAVETAPAVFEGVGVVEQFGKSIDFSIPLVDESGHTVRLGDYFEKSDIPIVIAPMYYSCPMLCQLIADGLVNGINESKLVLGKDFKVVSVSIDPDDSAMNAKRFKAEYTKKLEDRHDKAAWYFLLGDSNNTHRLTDRLGYFYKPDSAGEIAHQAAIIVVSPRGKIVRYLYGIEYPARTFQFAIREARLEKGRPSIDQLMLYCYKYDPSSRSYALEAMNVMRVGGVLTLVFLGLLVLGLRAKKK